MDAHVGIATFKGHIERTNCFEMHDCVWAVQLARNIRDAEKKASEVPNDRKTEQVKGATPEATEDMTTPTVAMGTSSATTTTETAMITTESAAHGAAPPATEATSRTADMETPEPREEF